MCTYVPGQVFNITQMTGDNNRLLALTSLRDGGSLNKSPSLVMNVLIRLLVFYIIQQNNSL